MPSSSIKKTSWALTAVAVALVAASSEAFTMPSTTTTSSNNYLMSRTSIPKTPFSNAAFLTTPTQSKSQSLSKSSQLQMGFNLPPPPPDPKADIQSILKTTGLIGAIVLFFLSPLGGIFFALTNSLLLLLILTPFLASIGFTIWQSLYTIEAPCPSCGVPARVLKDDEAGPNICLSCGQMIRATVDKDGIELCNDPNDVFDEGSRISSLFDLFTGGNGVGEAGSFMGGSNGSGLGSGGIGDGDPSVFFGDNRGSSNNGNNDAEDQKNKKKRESTVIDVDVTPE
eukprot:550590_1